MGFKTFTITGEQNGRLRNEKGWLSGGVSKVKGILPRGDLGPKRLRNSQKMGYPESTRVHNTLSMGTRVTDAQLKEETSASLAGPMTSVKQGRTSQASLSLC